MAIVVTPKIMLDGIRNAIVQVKIEGDGIGPDLANYVIYDSSISTVNNTLKLKVVDVTSAFTGFAGRLYWGGSPDEFFMDIPPNLIKEVDYRKEGGLNNSTVTSPTGQILLSTDGLSSGVNSTGYLILSIVKRGS